MENKENENEKEHEMERIVYAEDALAWLGENSILEGSSLIASMPDISEFHGISLNDWKEWFIGAAKAVISKTPDNGVSIFYQTDIKYNGVWVDKSYLCQKAAESLGSELLWHKILCRIMPGKITFGRPAYTHILCFSKNLRLNNLGHSTTDVLPSPGDKTWERGMGLEACLLIGKFIKENTQSNTIIHPFCGQGSMLAVANRLGLKAIGIERSLKRAEMARVLILNDEMTKFAKFANFIK